MIPFLDKLEARVSGDVRHALVISVDVTSRRDVAKTLEWVVSQTVRRQFAQFALTEIENTIYQK